ncbi:MULTISPECIES: aldo/keto reductase [unclassified Oceanispirochaeta]|uniref:aldo/keto reductase n=1 Tax=unclassified Oceanispirochaeta TaxID=2635722 RepID=UPI000E09BE4B|nr:MULTISPECIES: aldo/keto reductase [unclassified Oceanispirochaeta]MBF9014311.1 aldo/keto reductase [Oceanispirochaeta sp. M2]NPD71197.1 L-glyceraldehyde 3-phosphate reductase [Oceanispirochaeta sp. M1]RDG33585.1 L-glyceraldehyde 3-phosphate reductase [Oceanispirochaeta sp. M1]
MHYKPSENRYDKMKYKRCGISGIKLPRLALGLWHNFGENDDFETMENLVFKAFDLGINHFDLANNYGPPPGSAEENFGKILKTHLHGHRDEMLISTKAGYLMWPGPYGEWGSRKYMLSSLDQSLARLGLEYVDIFYSHRPDPETPLEETMGALDTAVRSGKALYAGISNYPAEEAADAIEILRDLGTPCLIHQPSYSMLNRWVEGELDSLLIKEGVGGIAFSPLAQGLLSSKYLGGEIPEDSRAALDGFLKKEKITENVISMLQELNSIAQQRSQSLAQMAISWILHNPAITTVLIGASRVSQLEENVKSLENLEFSDNELSKINGILEKNSYRK